MPSNGAIMRLLLGVTALVVAFVAFIQLFYGSRGYTYAAPEFKRTNKRDAELNMEGNQVCSNCRGFSTFCNLQV